MKSQKEEYSIIEEKGCKIIYRVLSTQPEPIAVVYPEKEAEKFNIDVRFLGKEFGFKNEEEAVATAIHLHEKVYASLPSI